MDPRDLYCKGSKVWVADAKEIWVGATIAADLKSNNRLSVELSNGTELDINVGDNPSLLPPLRNPEVLVGANDLTTLSYLHEPAVLHNLTVRFINYDTIYTYCGIVLVAINPYADLSIYGPEIISAYSGQAMGEMDPHIFAVAEDAYRKMVEEGTNQSIIVSGESGAGKTVSAKFAMRFFANVGGSATETAVERKVLASNPIMEAIGNAKTIRNDNSSRFGKYIEINFDAQHHIIGAHMRTYLLEKSRLVFQAPDERAYHIFYQLCASHQDEDLQELNLGPPQDFYYINQGANDVIDGVDDEKDFAATKNAMTMLGIYSGTQRMVFRVLAAVLHLGNVTIRSHGRKEDECSVPDDDFSVHMVSVLLGVDRKQLQKWLCNRKIVATGDVYVKPLTPTEANLGRDALAKHIYSQLFKWIVEHINDSLSTSLQRKSFIGVLDIYGFETFEVNSFEQFCINYANEKLQQQFNMHVFKLEQEEYTREGITWSFIDFYDNQPCIDLIEAKLGLLDLLDEECRMPKGADASWARKLYKQHLKTASRFGKPRLSETSFIIRHYADDVTYDCMGFVEKNRDTINTEHLSLLRASEYELVGELFASNDPSAMFSPRKRASSRVGANAPSTKKTVGSEFRDSLRRLMDTLNSTSPHYVRCIKPNDAKAPMQIDAERFIQQLRACGVLETIRISAAGFPSRWAYEEFFDRYRMLLPWKQLDWDDLRSNCFRVLDLYIKDEDKFQLGKTKIFFRAGQVAYLEKLRSDKLKESCVRIQKHVRGWLTRNRYTRMRKAAVKIQCWVRGYQARCLVRFIRQTYAAILLQSVWRGWFVRRLFLRTRCAVVVIQSYARGTHARKLKRALLREQKAIVIQTFARRFLAQKQYALTRRAVILLQCCVRRMRARKELKQLKIEARSVEHYKTVTKGMENKIISLQQRLNSEVKERNALLEKTKKFDAVSDELAAIVQLRPKYEAAQKQTHTLENEVSELRNQLSTVTSAQEVHVEQLKVESSDKDQIIASQRKEIEALSTQLEASSENQEGMENDFKARLAAALAGQKGAMLAEFSAERTSHQKMLREYTRLEQRFANLEDELTIERSPEKAQQRSRTTTTESGSSLDYSELPKATTDDIIRALREELAAERLAKEEMDSVGKMADGKMADIVRQRDRLESEDLSLRKELEVLRSAMKEDEEEDNFTERKEKAMSGLMEQIDEMRLENENLRLKLDEAMKQHRVIALENGDAASHEKEAAVLRSANLTLKSELDSLRQERKQTEGKINRLTTSQGAVIDSDTVSESAQHDLARMTQENLKLKEALVEYEAELKTLRQRSLISSPKQRRGSRKMDGASLLSADQNSLRQRASSMHVKYSDELTAGKLVMTYAGLFRKNDGVDSKSKDGVVAPGPGTDQSAAAKKAGMLKFSAEKESALVRKLVLELKPSDVEAHVPGLPAHLVFMAIRYVDKINDERIMQSLLTNVISGIKKAVKDHPGDLDLEAFWLANTCRLSHDMRQYSGEKAFQSHNATEHALMNFDLSEYRQVLSDLSVQIYQDMAKTIQDRVKQLIVPGMLEYESIPGVSSSKPFGRGKKKAKNTASFTEEIITVKDITNKLSAILAVLNAHCVEPDLIKQVYRQIFYYIGVTMLNSLLLRKDMCHWSRGMQIRFNITQLEEWCRTNQLDNQALLDVLEPTIQATQLLQVSKKSLDDVDAICSVCTSLNTLQVQKILSMYTPANEFEPRVPGSVIRAVVAKGEKTDPMFLMRDMEYMFPVSFPFTPSSFAFETAVIPPALEVDGISVV